MVSLAGASCGRVDHHRAPARAAGTLVTCATSAGLLDRIIRRLAPDELAAVPPAAELFARHGGNLRDALRELYDVYAAVPDTEARDGTDEAQFVRR